MKEIGQHVGPIDEEETDEELASIHKQWEKEEASLLPDEDETIEEPETEPVLEEPPKFAEEGKGSEHYVPPEEAPLSEDKVALVAEEPAYLEKEIEQVEEEAPDAKEDIQQEQEKTDFEEVNIAIFSK